MARKYQEYFESGICENKSEELIAAVSSLNLLNLDDCYWLGKCLSVCSGPECCRLSINCLKRAFELGLTYSSDKERYAEVSLLISKMYIQQGEFVTAKNYLQNFVDSVSAEPESIIMDYLMSQIMSDQIFFIVENPDSFFKRLDSLSPENKSKVYSLFLKRIRDLEIEHEEYRPTL